MVHTDRGLIEPIRAALEGARTLLESDARCLHDIKAREDALRQIDGSLELLMLTQDALRAAARNDRSQYRHHEPRPFDGRTPIGGTIWLTPREIIRRVLYEPKLATADDPGNV